MLSLVLVCESNTDQTKIDLDYKLNNHEQESNAYMTWEANWAIFVSLVHVLGTFQVHDDETIVKNVS